LSTADGDRHIGSGNMDDGRAVQVHGAVHGVLCHGTLRAHRDWRSDHLSGVPRLLLHSEGPAGATLHCK
jgi:hypothetical protein